MTDEDAELRARTRARDRAISAAILDLREAVNRVVKEHGLDAFELLFCLSSVLNHWSGGIIAGRRKGS
jgi:hypothetical protein